MITSCSPILRSITKLPKLTLKIQPKTYLRLAVLKKNLKEKILACHPRRDHDSQTTYQEALHSQGPLHQFHL